MRLIAAFSLMALSLGACDVTGGSGSDAGPTQLATQADLSAITGKTVTFEEGRNFVISDAGTFEGVWDGSPITGTYEMRDGYFCRVITASARGPAGEDCQLMILDGNTVTVTRERGSGASFQYTIS